MKHLYAIVLFLCTVVSAFSQKSLSEYYFVNVPRQFDFQSSKDQYRLNTLLRHLLNTNGFNAIYEEEMGSLPRCEGLFADVIQEKTFLKTKLYIVLKDCYSTEVYRSESGQSKEKDLTQSFPEALQYAFESVKRLGVKQQDISRLREKSDTETTHTEKDVVVKDKPAEIITEKTAKATLSVYQLGDRLYFLEKNGNDFILYKNHEDTDRAVKIGDLKSTSRSGIYLFESKGVSQLANFDENKNLIIDSTDDSGNTKQIVYVLIEE